MVQYRNSNDEAHGIFRVEDVGFSDGTKLEEIEKVLRETSLIPIKPDNLMTCEALMKYIRCDDKNLQTAMQNMRRGSSLPFKCKNGKSVTIKRYTTNLYTGEYKG